MSKKFMFSAVAVVAFSFAGMANTGGEEKIELNGMEVIMDAKKDDPCFDRAYIVMHQAYNAGYDDQMAAWYMNVAYALCKGYSIKDIVY